MKRPGKCVGKRKYAHYSTACKMAKWKFLNEHIELGVYTCPTCLDFHLTSKYCNLKHLHKRWLKNPIVKKVEVKQKVWKQKKLHKKELTQIIPKVKEKKKWGGDVDDILRQYQPPKRNWLWHLKELASRLKLLTR